MPTVQGTYYSHAVPLIGEEETPGCGCLRSQGALLWTVAGHHLVPGPTLDTGVKQTQPLPSGAQSLGTEANVTMPCDKYLPK